MARINVRVQPRSSRNEVIGFSEDGSLRIRVTAPPANGQANAAVEREIAVALRTSKTSVQIVRGMSSRNKIVAIEGLSEVEIRKRLDNAL